MRKFKVGVAGVGQRADVFVAGKYPEFARSALARLFDDGLVLINSKPAKAGQNLRLRAQISVDDKLLKTQPEPIDLPVLYEDEDVVVINKPAGVLSHSKGALNTEPTVASFLIGKITDKNLTGNRAGIVHRLDRRTSGVIIGAKSEKALKHLQKQFSTRKTTKIYQAIVEGHPEPPAAIIDAPIERDPKRPQSFRVGAGGKPAQTQYNTLKTFKKGDKYHSLLSLTPVTGRTHQLRIHLAYIGHPIVGDGVYGHDGPVMLLHALSLGVNLPNGQKGDFSAPLPKYFEDFMQS